MLKNVLLMDKPSLFIREHKEELFGIIEEFRVCDGFDQHNDYHVYDVFEHILHVLDYVENNYLLRIAALFHDIGKPLCMKLDENGEGHFFGHWDESIKIFNKYAYLFELDDEEIKLINDLIYYHDLMFKEDNLNMFRELFGDNIDLLISLKKADVLAQNTKYNDRIFDILEKANKIKLLK